MSLPEEPKRPRSKALDSGYGRQDKSHKQEERVAKALKGRKQPASGALPVPGLKGDIREDRFLIEAKRTDAQSIRVKASWLVKIEAEAEAIGKFPALSLELGEGLPLSEKDWCLIPMSVFKKLLGKERE